MNRFGMGLREYRLNRQRDRYMENLAKAMAMDFSAEQQCKIMYWEYMVEAVEEELEEEGYEIIQ